MKGITKNMRFRKGRPSEEILNLLDQIEYDKKDENKLRNTIQRYIKNEYPILPLVENWKLINLLDRDTSSLESNILRYGDEIGRLKWEEKNRKCTRTKEDLYTLYGAEEAARRLAKRGASLANYIERHGEIEGKIKWKEYCEKRAETFRLGRKEGRYASRNLAWYQNKYGADEGYKIWNDKRQSQAYKVSTEYYIEKYGVEEGRRLIKKTKSHGLAYYIEKYGVEEGTTRHSDIVRRITKNRPRYNVSRWAMECCYEIKKHIDDLYYFGENEKRFILTDEWHRVLNRWVISPDICYNNKIIELNGDAFHANPILFESHEICLPFKESKAADIWEYDELRKKYFQSKHYDVLVIWEYDFNANKEGVIEQCVKFLN